MKPFFKSLFFNILTLFSIVTLSFLLIYFIPGDPADFILKDRGGLEDKNQLKESLGLNKPFFYQYSYFLKNLLFLDMGRSILTDEPVFETLAEQSLWTLNLAFPALFLAFSWGVMLGVFSLKWRLSFFDRFFKKSKQASFVSKNRLFDFLPILLFSIPAFVLAPLLTGFFALYLKWLPVSGAGTFSHLILPSVSLALPLGAVLMKITRTSLLEVSHSDFIKTALAKGLAPERVYYRHILFNAFIPIITVAGLQMGALLTGTVIVETLFDRPGLGTLLYRSILNRDYPLIQGAVLWIALLYVFINRLTDRLYLWVNPQMRKEI